MDAIRRWIKEHHKFDASELMTQRTLAQWCDVHFHSRVKIPRTLGGRSLLHDELAERAMVWLANRATGKGIRGATEICLAPRYVADAFCIGALQSMKAQQLYAQWLKAGSDDERADSHQDLFWVFEAKVSRADFLSTFGPSAQKRKVGNRLVPIGHLHWIVTVPGVVRAKDKLDFWGVLIKSGRGLRMERPALYRDMSELDAGRLAYTLLWKPSPSAWSRRLNLRWCPNCLEAPRG